MTWELVHHNLALLLIASLFLPLAGGQVYQISINDTSELAQMAHEVMKPQSGLIPDILLK